MSRRAMNPVRVAVRDGAIVRIKRCAGCGEDKICVADSPRSEFSTNGKTSTGSMAWKPLCKVCNQVEVARYRQSDRGKAQRRARHHERMATDPAYREAKRVETRKNKRAAMLDPEKRARARAASRAWKARQRRERRDEFNALQRIDYRLRMERQGRSARQVRTVVDGTKPTGPVEPFERWLRAYGQEVGIEVGTQLAEHLGINPRRVTAVLNGETSNIALDIVDRALLNADRVVDVQINGVPVKTSVFDIGDLYPQIDGVAC